MTHPVTERFAASVGVAVGEWPERLQAAIGETGRALRDDLARSGDLVEESEAVDVELSLPPVLEAMLATACAEASDDEAETWSAHYTRLMPTLLGRALWQRSNASFPWLHTPLRPETSPRLRGALERLDRLISGTATEAMWGAAGSETSSPHALSAAAAGPRAAGGAGAPHPHHSDRAGERLPARLLAALDTGETTLAELYVQTHFGTSMPMLYTYPHDLAAYAREHAGGRPRAAIVDDRLGAPFVHEVAHLDTEREPLLPPYLEECVAGWLGCLALPSLAWPEAGTDHALYAAPSFTQVGDALADAIGPARLLAGHTGRATWTETFGPALASRLTALGWAQHLRVRAPHFLGEPWRARPWTRVAHLARSPTAGIGLPAAHSLAALEAMGAVQLGVVAPALPGVDRDDRAWERAMLERALRSACLCPGRGPDGEYRVTNGWPGEVTLDWRGLELRAAPLGCDAHPVSHVLPMATARRRVRAGVDAETVTLGDGDLADLPARVAALAAALTAG